VSQSAHIMGDLISEKDHSQSTMKTRAPFSE
jgi:hypothetical protein